MPKRGDKQGRGSARDGRTPAGARRAEDSKTDGELRRFEPVSDELVLAAIDRAERHRTGEREGIPFWTVVAHLGFVRSGWTSRRLRPQLEELVTHGLVSSTRRKTSFQKGCCGVRRILGLDDITPMLEVL